MSAVILLRSLLVTLGVGGVFLAWVGLRHGLQAEDVVFAVAFSVLVGGLDLRRRRDRAGA